MHCRRLVSAPGVFVIVCGSREPRRSCSTPQCQNWASKQCDFPVSRKGKAGTCDAHVCERCAVPQPGADRDFCLAHSKVAP
jgi:hypothetical protein